MDRSRCVAFTGYRLSKMLKSGVDEASITTIASECREAIMALVESGFTTFLSGMSEGFDLIAAEAVLSLKSEYPSIELVAVVPFRGQADRYSEAEREEYNSVLEQADNVVALADSYLGSYQYLQRNEYLVDHCSHLLCYFDGQKGGTMYTYKRAQKLHIPITNICKGGYPIELTLF